MEGWLLRNAAFRGQPCLHRTRQRLPAPRAAHALPHSSTHLACAPACAAGSCCTLAWAADLLTCAADTPCDASYAWYSPYTNVSDPRHLPHIKPSSMPPQCNVPALTPRPGFLQAPGELARGGRGRAAAGAPVSARAEAHAFGALRGAAAAALAALPTSLQQDEALLAQPSAAAALPAQPGAAAAAQGGALSPAEQVAAVPAVRTMSLQPGEAAPAACAPTFAGGRPARQRGCAAPGAPAVQGGQADAPAGSQDTRAAMPSGAARALRWRLALEWRASYKRRAHWPQVALGMCVQALSACLYSTKGI